MTRAQRQAIIENVGKMLLEDGQSPNPGPDAPAWVKHSLALIKQAQRADDPWTIRNPIVSVQPMPRPVGGIAFYRPKYGAGPQWEPSAVDRLAAVAEPDGELAKKIAAWDKANDWSFETFDMVADPAVPGAHP